MNKILVTGANGFIGSALIPKLLTQEYEVLSLNSSDGDIAEDSTLKKYANYDFFRVFHLAAKTFVPDSWKDPQGFYRTNVLGTVNTLEFCRQKSIPLTFISAYLYGQPEKLPINEDDPIKPNNPYAHSKYLAEQASKFYAKEFGVKVVIIRPFNVYGIGQNDKFLIPLIIKQALEADEIGVKDLTPKRDYIYLDDLIDALIITIGTSNTFAIYNIGSGYSISVKDVISTIQEILGTNKKIVSDHIVRKNEMNDVFADITKANKELGWYPNHAFHEGIKRIVEYEKHC
jgi:nucleoside-diphosphate-sugar epimerase